MSSNGVIVVLSYPDTVVRPAYSEFSSKIWPLLGVGSKNGVQAGHAALLLLSKETGNVDYYDFGRYITSYGKGRVRSKETDAELSVPVKAIVKNNELANVDELLLWLDRHPEKTHGSGRLVASVNNHINYEKAQDFINNMITAKEIPYGAFVKGGSNCARFVTDVIINSSTNKSVRSKLKKSNLFTPSPVGNVIKGSTEDVIFKAVDQEIEPYVNRSQWHEFFKCFLNKVETEVSLLGNELPDKDTFYLEEGTWLGGIGCGAWFKIESVTNNRYKIARYTGKGVKDFEGDFVCQTNGFEISEAYSFVHSTNCKEAVISQNNKNFLLKRVS